jgi:RNA polymerase sigma factor (sigma-70 family)
MLTEAVRFTCHGRHKTLNSCKISQNSVDSEEPFRFDDHYVARLRFRDANTLSHFHSYFRRSVLAKLRAKCGWDPAEDLAQDVFAAALEGIDRGAPKESAKLPGYVMGICSNISCQYLDQLMKMKSRMVPIGELDFPERRPSPEDQVTTGSLFDTARNVLRRLSARDREALVRIIYYGEDRKTVSDEMRLSLDQLRLVLCRALSRFKKEWERAQLKKGRSANGNADQTKPR